MTRLVALIVFLLGFVAAPLSALALLAAGIEDVFYLVELPLAVLVICVAATLLPTKY